MTQTSSENEFPVICVGGTAGGLDAYERLLRCLPPDLGAAIVIVNHLRVVTTRLHGILPRCTQMPVGLITDGLWRVSPQAHLQATRVAGRHHGVPAFLDRTLAWLADRRVCLRL